VNVDEFLIVEKVVKELRDKVAESEVHIASVIQVCWQHLFQSVRLEQYLILQLPTSSQSIFVETGCLSKHFAKIASLQQCVDIDFLLVIVLDKDIQQIAIFS